MSPPREALADLHRRYDGPIPDHLRNGALAGTAVAIPTPRQRASRDIDRLALASVQALSGWRAAAATVDTLIRRQPDPMLAPLVRALQSYRDAGVTLHVSR